MRWTSGHGGSGRWQRRKPWVMDEWRYPQKVKITDDQMATIRLRSDVFHGDWNYVIQPHER
ncbi:MAG: hypothetical protein E6I53_16160 [Chloroflexi bacterium]|nr:MAG: hypothetical protein E6I53_16160 [Chloroflexota bacterium]